MVVLRQLMLQGQHWQAVQTQLQYLLRQLMLPAQQLVQAVQIQQQCLLRQLVPQARQRLQAAQTQLQWLMPLQQLMLLMVQV
jgi:hypothetical protein